MLTIENLTHITSGRAAYWTQGERFYAVHIFHQETTAGIIKHTISVLEPTHYRHEVSGAGWEMTRDLTAEQLRPATFQIFRNAIESIKESDDHE